MLDVRRRRPAWPTGLALAALGVACQQVLSIDGTVTVTHDACGLAASGTCRSCIAASCCTQASACAADPSCAPYEACLIGCGADYACRATCLISPGVPTGEQVPALDQCVVAHCESACGVSCGATGSFAEPDAAVACQDCIANRVCSQAESCGSNLDCEELGHCALGCFTADCTATCTSLHADAAATFSSLIFGAGSYCLDACGAGNYWECLGKVTWPLAKSKDFTLTVNTSIGDATVSLAGLTVKACDAADTMCVHALATGLTDAEGSTTMKLPSLTSLPGYGFGGYLEVSGTGIPTTLSFLGFPLSEPQASLSLLLLSQASLANLTSLVRVPAGDAGGTAPFQQDLTRGTVAVGVGDCYHNGAPGVTVTATMGTDAATVRRYYASSALENGATTTNRSGLAFFLNAPAGATLGFKATPASIGRDSSSVTVFTRPLALSVVEAVPGPGLVIQGRPPTRGAC